MRLHIKRIMCIFCMIVSIVGLLSGCTVQAETKVPSEEPSRHEEPVVTTEPEMVEVSVEDDITNILLLGMDARSYDTNSRSDTMILVSYNETKHEVRMVSFMRDSWVNIPGYGWNRLNAATIYGGPDLLIDTLKENFDIEVDHYAQIKFDDFREVIDIIGGIDVELTDSEIRYINRKLHSDDGDWSNDITAEPGVVHLNGAQALWHCRNRSIGNADYERTERQREVLQIICEKVINEFSIGMAIQLVPMAFECIDTDMNVLEISNMAIQFIRNGMPEIESTRAPFDGMFLGANKNGASVLELDIDANRDAVQEFLTDGWTHTELQEAA